MRGAVSRWPEEPVAKGTGCGMGSRSRPGPPGDRSDPASRSPWGWVVADAWDQLDAEEQSAMLREVAKLHHEALITFA